MTQEHHLYQENNLFEKQLHLSILENEIKVRQAYVMYYDARIKSEAYVDRNVRHGSLDGPLLTKDELLKDELNTMLRHIHLMTELVNSLHDLKSSK